MDERLDLSSIKGMSDSFILSGRKIPHVSTTKGVDSIIEYILVDHPDFSDLEPLTKQIERATLKFIKDVESFG